MTTTIKALALAALVALAACGPSGSSPDAGHFNNIDADQRPPDSFGGPNFGQLCTTSNDCGAGGYCVASQNGNICTYGCDAGCPDYYHCRATDVGGTLVSLCLPLRFDFCKPCTDDAACDGGICVQLEGAGYCLPPCPFEGTCPSGYSCGTDPTSQHQGSYCVPNTGSCTCNAPNAGQIRTCSTMDAAGTCYGTETCMPDNGGWSGCNAPTASTEVCDGMDNDCDQLIDDGVSGGACPITNGNGTCMGVALCTGSGLTCQGKTPAAETCNYSDDDCDGMTDEGYANLAQTCTAGIGGCERFGVYRCTAAGDATECSVTAGTPQSELCNGLDDDCDTKTDENFTAALSYPSPLGASCSTGVGTCARQGNYVCSANGSGTTCSVTAGTPTTETCNNLDDDCDGVVDNGFKNSNGVYDKNTACGSCTIDCTVLYNLPNASGVCSTGSGSPQCSMVCAPNSFDIDLATSNGCELVLDPDAIYVSTDDTAAADDSTCGLGPVGTGAGNHPCLTIAQGIVRAGVTARSKIRVANGIYDEAVTIPNGKKLLGGHRPDTWQRDVAATGTLITGVGTIATIHDYTVQAINISAPTVFEGFVVIGSLNGKTGGNSYAIYVSNGSASLSIINNVIYGGRGGPGSGGGSGPAGATGVDGIGRASNPAGYDAFTATGTGTCDASNNRQYANGAVMSCGTDDVSGGNGGGNRCAPVQNTKYSGLDGFPGQAGDPLLGGASGGAATAGYDMLLSKTSPPFPSTVCYIPVAPNGDPIPTYGADGAAGKNGGNGPSGVGCSAVTGSILNGHWVGGSGGAGTAGGNGGGGAGGGGGGGAHCDTASGVCTHDNLGAHGGGGGSGGCGGGGGTGAGGGGGAFDVFIVGGTAPVVTGNSFVRGEGGRGGSGGAGGAGGPGGAGADGGLTALFCASEAGRGGNGGNGGNGAGGGGGCGGGSFGIFTSGIGSPNYCQAAAANTFSSGAGGAGGTGGYSLINTGGAGTVGVLAPCQFN